MPAFASTLRRSLAAACLLCLPGPVLAQDTVRLASDDWCPYVCASDGRIGGGYIVEVATRALGATGWQVEPLLLPLNRAMRQTVNGELDGVFAPPDDARLLLSPVLAYSRACFYVRAGSSWKFRALGSLKGVRVGVIGDYEYDNGPMDAYIVANLERRDAIDVSYGASAVLTNIRKLLGERFDVLLEHDLVMRRAMQTAGVEGQLRQAGCLEQSFPLRIGFARGNPRSVQWLAALAEGMRKLERSGELAVLRERYGFPAVAQGEMRAR